MRLIRVFVASPGDVKPERDSLEAVIEELQLIFDELLPEKDLRLKLLRWEKDTYPSMLPRLRGGAEPVIDEEIGKFDVFVGIMWQRFGTPTDDAGSGTEHEFNRAAEKFGQLGSPELMFYFSLAPKPLLNMIDYEEYGKVLAFRTRLQEMGLVAEYPSPEEFPKRVRQNLIMLLARELVPRLSEDRKQRAEPVTDETSASERELHELVRQYEKIRRTMQSGPERTEKMTIVMARMKALAPAITLRLRSLAQSEVGGERLAAIAILGWEPSEDYLLWLAGRFDRSVEKPFIGYYAGLALLQAVRALPSAAVPQVRDAIKRASDVLKSTDRSGDFTTIDRYRVLVNAQAELDRRVKRAEAEHE
jgi:hypothetical protein